MYYAKPYWQYRINVKKMYTGLIQFYRRGFDSQKTFE